MKLDELVEILMQRPLVTRSDLAVRWRVSLRRVDQIRQEDPAFPEPRYVIGPRWTVGEIAHYERRHREQARA